MMETFPTPRVLIVADNLLARTGLAAMLNQSNAISIVGQVAGDDKLESDLAAYRPDVAVMDAGYDPEAALPSIRLLVEAELAQVILVPNADSASLILPTLRESGRFGLLLRDGDPALLPDAILAAWGGLAVLDPALLSALLPDASLEPIPLAEALTMREMEVLRLLARGLTNRAIGHALGISQNTVKFHVNAILGKLDAQSRTEAVVRATQLGLLSL